MVYLTNCSGNSQGTINPPAVHIGYTTTQSLNTCSLILKNSRIQFLYWKPTDLVVIQSRGKKTPQMPKLRAASASVFTYEYSSHTYQNLAWKHALETTHLLPNHTMACPQKTQNSWVLVSSCSFPYGWVPSLPLLPIPHSNWVNT